MTYLEKYSKVNNTESLKELAEVIREFGNEPIFGVEGFILGRTQVFNSENMAMHCETYSLVKHNVLTREFGIRQQAMMLLFYGDNY